MKGDVYTICISPSTQHNDRWLYGLHLAIDANFRLKLKDRSVDDLEFGPGWAYFVNEDHYQAEIKNHAQPMEVCLLMIIPVHYPSTSVTEKRLYIDSSSNRTRNVKA